MSRDMGRMDDFMAAYPPHGVFQRPPHQFCLFTPMLSDNILNVSVLRLNSLFTGKHYKCNDKKIRLITCYVFLSQPVQKNAVNVWACFRIFAISKNDLT